MPAYNCGHYIKEAIASILNQTIDDIELLIVDDGSTDNTWEIISHYQDKRISAHKNTKNIGYLKSTNKLFELAKAPLITFQDADDWSEPSRLEIQFKKLTNDSALLFCGTFCRQIFNNESTRVRHYPTTNHEIKKELNRGRTALFCGASIMIRRSALEEIGGYRSFFDRIGAEDIDWYLRALQLGEAENIPEALYCYRQHEASISNATTDKLFQHCADLAYAFHMQRRERGVDSIDFTKNLRVILESKLEHSTGKTTNFNNFTALLKTRLASSKLGATLAADIRKRRAKKILAILASLPENKPVAEPLVSIYIATKDRAELLKRAIKSCLDQSYKNIEVVIVDDGSSDNTEEACNTFRTKKIVYLKNPLSKGAASSRNRAIEACRGEYITGIDDDDEMLPHRVKDFVRHNSSHYSFTYSSTIEKTKLGNRHPPAKKNEITLTQMKERNEVGNQVFIARSKVLKIGGYDTNLSTWEDYDLWYRLIKEYGPAKQIDNRSMIIDQSHNQPSVTGLDTGIGFKQFTEKHKSDLSEKQVATLKARDYLSRRVDLTLRESITRANSRRTLAIYLKNYIRNRIETRTPTK